MASNMGLIEVYNVGDLHLEAKLDVVAVHGIGADPIRTWTANNINWLSDPSMLPKDLPESRIMCFGYESQWLGKKAIRQRLPSVANSLLNCLIEKRKSSVQRPLIFIGHCFGGLVAEKAFLEACLHEYDYPGISNSVVGFVTLGTPHRGSGSQSAAARIATIASAFGYGDKKSLLNVIGEDSEIISDLVHAFVRSINAKGVPMCCFFEQQASDVLKLLRPSTLRWPTRKEIVVDEDSACIPGVPRFGVASNHFQMHRCLSNTDNNFKTLKTEILKMTDRARSKGKVCPEAEINITIDEQDQQALDAIFQTDPRDDLAQIYGESGCPQPETIAWIRDQQSYQNWQHDQAYRLLWIVGNPGKGKTVIAASEARQQELQSSKSTDQLTAYFFCNNGDNRRKDSLSILRGIIYQICNQRHVLSKVLTAEYKRQKDLLLSFPSALQTMWRLLHQIIKLSRLQRLSVVIDALDECNTANMEKFLVLLRPYFENRETTSSHTNYDIYDSRIHWFITSRREEFVSVHLDEAPQIDLEENSSHVQNAVQKFVDNKVEYLSRIKKYDNALRETVRHTLKERAEGTFLWVALACEELSKPRVRAMNTKTVLSRFPAGLNALYGRILDQVLCGEESEGDEIVIYAKQILHAMAMAFRPLKLVELAAASGLPLDIWTSSSLITDCVKACGSLVSIQGDTVHFIHLSAKTYVFSVDGIFSCNRIHDHASIARRCFGALFEHVHLFSDNQTGLTLDTMRYQVRFWTEHATRSGLIIEEQITQNMEFMARKSRFREAWFDAYWSLSHIDLDEKPGGMSLLLMSAYLGLNFVVENLLQRSDSILNQDRDSSMNTALIWAAKMGHMKIVEMLMSHGAEKNAYNKLKQTAGYCAAANGYDDILCCLAEHGADLQLPDQNGWTPIHRAVNSGHEASVRSLIDKGADLELKDYASWTPLQRASSNGHMGILSLLIKHSARIEVRDREGMSILQTAAWNGHQEVVCALLDQGAAIEARDDEGWTALHHSCWAGHLDTTELLIRRGSSVDCRNNEGNTPLFLATWNGHTPVVKALLEYDAQADAFCADGETALMQAAWAGHISVLKLLIDKGAAVNAVTPSGISALHQASSNGQEDAIQYLLEVGADPRLKDADGQTAFEYAEENSYPSTAKLLQDPETPVVDQGIFDSTSQRESISLDKAVATAISVEPELCIVLPHGHACSSSPWKVGVLTEPNRQYFLKTTTVNPEMYKGEFESLKALNAIVPSLCPSPIEYGSLTESSGTFLITQFVDVQKTARHFNTSSPVSFAQKLAKLHTAQIVDKCHGSSPFGFHVMTFAGPIPQNNDWKPSWADFYANNRLRHIATIVNTRHLGEQALTDQIEQVAAEVVPKLLSHDHLNGGHGIHPSLVHGDLWSGNKARGFLSPSEAMHTVVEDYAFDAACCYAHSEYELGLMRMFGGFTSGFFTEYHKLVPKTQPAAEYEDRMLLYQVYHWLINYAISGGGFKDEAISCMDKLLAKYGNTK